jgi:hypothetical protein
MLVFLADEAGCRGGGKIGGFFRMLRRPAAPAAPIRRGSFKVCAGEIRIGRLFLKEQDKTADKYEASDFFLAEFRHGGQ